MTEEHGTTAIHGDAFIPKRVDSPKRVDAPRGGDPNAAAKAAQEVGIRELTIVQGALRNTITKGIYLISGRLPHEATEADVQFENRLWQEIQDHFNSSAVDYSGGRGQK